MIYTVATRVFCLMTPPNVVNHNLCCNEVYDSACRANAMNMMVTVSPRHMSGTAVRKRWQTEVHMHRTNKHTHGHALLQLKKFDCWLSGPDCVEV